MDICAFLELHCRVVPVSERAEGDPPVYWVQLRQPNNERDFAAVLVEEGFAQYNSGIIFFSFNLINMAPVQEIKSMATSSN